MTRKSINNRVLHDLVLEYGQLSPDSDGTNYAGRVEAALEKVRDESLQAPLHFLAASALSLQGSLAKEDSARRALAHLDSCRATLINNSAMAAEVAMMRATLCIKIEDPRDRKSVVATVRACEDALATLDPKESDAGTVAALAFNTAKRVVALEGRSADIRAESLLRLAFERYQSVGRKMEASDAAAELAALALARLKGGALSEADRQETFAEGLRFVEYAMSADDVSNLTWAQRNEIAADLVRFNLRRSADETASDAVAYLDRALIRYQRLGDSSSASACAASILRIMYEIRPPWTSNLAERYVYYLKEFAKADSNNSSDSEATIALLSAGAWAKVEDSLDSLQRMGEFASNALAAAQQASADALCASAQMLIGNSLLRTSAFLRQIDVRTGYEPSGARGSPSSLQDACRAFEEVCRYAERSRDTNLQAQALRLLGVALGRRVGEYGEWSAFDQAVQVLREAASLSQDGDRATAWLNLGNMLLAGRRNGLGMKLDSINEVIDEVENASFFNIQIMERLQHLRSCAYEPSPLEEGDFPQYLGYRRYNMGEGSRSEIDDSRIVALLLYPASDELKEGILHLSRFGTQILGDFDLPCPSCGKTQHFELPIIIENQSDSQSGLEPLLKISEGKKTCRFCNVKIVMQNFIAIRSQNKEKPMLVYPDVLLPNVKRADGPDGLVLSQVGIISKIQEAWIGEPLGRGTLIPFGGIAAIDSVDPAFMLDVQRKIALGFIAFGLLNQTRDQISLGLRTCPDLINGPNYDVIEITHVLRELNEAAGNSEPIDPKIVSFLTAQINGLLQEARLHGPERAIEEFEIGWKRTSMRMQDAESAIRDACNAQKRCNLLNNYINTTSDYSSARQQAITDTFLSGAELEYEAMIAAGIRESDPIRFAGAEAALKGARSYLRTHLAEDRKRNSAAPGKALLSAALHENRPFVLLLRAFSGDQQTVPLSSLPPGVGIPGDNPTIGWRRMSLNADYVGHSTARIAGWLTGTVDILMVANVLDLEPPIGPAKLFMTDVEWRGFVFPLIAEASAILLLLPPYEDALTSGLQDELFALGALGRNADTVAILLKQEELEDDIFDSFCEKKKVENAKLLSIDDFAKYGFAQMFEESDLSDHPQLLVNTLMERIRR